MTPTWFEHAAFWSGVRRATVAPRSHPHNTSKNYQGSTEIWTRIAGFKVQSANHYTIEPWHVQLFLQTKLHLTTVSFSIVFSSSVEKTSKTLLPACFLYQAFQTFQKHLFPAGFEPATLCVWSTRDNHYTKETTQDIGENLLLPAEEWQSEHWWSKNIFIPSGDRTQDLWIRSPTRYPLR